MASCVRFVNVFAGLLAPVLLFAQANFTAQLRGTVSDSSGAIIPGATVSMTNEGTQVATRATTDSEGRYTFASLQPATYTISVDAKGFRRLAQSGLVLRVGQESVLPLKLEVGDLTDSVEVKADAVLLNSASSELGQEVTSRYITEVPLFNRDITKLAYLAPGVTEAQGFATDQTHENFVSNGQRNSSAELRLDGSIMSVPEAGEGAMFWSHYQPSIEIVEEFKVQTNGFSAQYGSNGGTVINIVSKSGTNEFHGSGYWFGQRSQMNANSFFANREGQDKPEYQRDQYGGSLGGPIIKNKTFFFFNYDRTRYNSPTTVRTTVPTDLQRQGDFSQTYYVDDSGTPHLQTIYDPTTAQLVTDSDGASHVVRQAYAGNKIPASQIDPIAAKVVQLYPGPTGDGDPYTHRNNFTRNYLLGQPAHQYNLRIDQNFDEKSRISGRFSKGYLRRQSPNDFVGNIGQGDEKNDYYNGVVEYNRTETPTFLWTLRASIDRHYQSRLASNPTNPADYGFPSILSTANGMVTFPEISIDGYQGLGISGWTQTIEAQTQWVFDAFATKVIGGHSVQFGGESRTLFTNFFQPGHPSGQFGFSQAITMQDFTNGNDYTQGNGLASFLSGWASSGQLTIHPSTAEMSRETSFFLQDDWKVSPKLTLNLGLRYEFSTPYNDRYNRLQIADFTADTGKNVPGIGEIYGLNKFVGKGGHAGSDWNNIAPRLGVAYQLNQKTVLRGGAGVYYGINYATSYQDLGAAFRKDLNMQTSLDSGLTRYATLANPFPNGGAAQGTQYGALNMWGFGSGSNQSETFRNSEIYQWSFSVQHELPYAQVVEAAYSANRSSHLPVAGTRNRNYLRADVRKNYTTAQLDEQVTNPFYPYFVGPNAIFNEPDSPYAQPTTHRINLLRPYPQFPGGFEGFAEFVANSWYNSLQVKYEKRYSHGLNLVGSYTLAKQTDDSSATSNGWLGNSPSVQDLNNIRGEYSVGATDTRHRLVFGGSYELPFGRKKMIGNSWNPVINGIFGEWQINGYLTLQSGLPLNIYMASGRLADGSQRPNVSGNPRSQYSIKDVVNCVGTCSYFNPAAFSDPGDQVPGNGPRFNNDLRGDGIRSLDFSLFKTIAVKEKVRVQLRAEFFNFTNTPRFADPDTGFRGEVGGSFGTISNQANSPRQVQMGARMTF